MNIITSKDKSDAARSVWTMWHNKPPMKSINTSEAQALWAWIDETPVGATCSPTMRALPAAPEPLAIEAPTTPVGPYERVVLERVSLERGAR